MGRIHIGLCGQLHHISGFSFADFFFVFQFCYRAPPLLVAVVGMRIPVIIIVKRTTTKNVHPESVCSD